MVPKGSGGGVAGVDGMLTPELVAEEVTKAMAARRFLVLPHPEALKIGGLSYIYKWILDDKWTANRL